MSYIGPKGTDTSGEEYRHGELVAPGNRGVWNEALLPGKYAFNTYAGAIVMVPTTNIILKWVRGEVGEHHYDENLAEVNLITKDAFEPLLPLSVVIHIDYKKAPLVIQRFGDIKMLVNQTLDPMVSAYFKNIGQTKTIIELIQQRSEIQKTSSVEMQEKFGHYNLELEEVLIGTPHSPAGDDKIETILMQLRDRPDRVREARDLREAAHRLPTRNASSKRPSRSPSSRPRSRSRRSTSRCRRTRRAPTCSAPCRTPSACARSPRPTPTG